MNSKAIPLSHGGYYLSAQTKDDEFVDTVYIDKDEPIFLLGTRGTRISGVQRRALKPEAVWLQSGRKISPKRFLLVIRYHYPLVDFPQELKDELREIELFFGIDQHGEGSTVHEGRMVATLSYRLAGDVDVVRNFNSTVEGLLYRHVIETLGHEISRI